eukprot:TRINITY_DN12063_c0_g1_i1.p1 TRINITY_DN12063_c0_g1~~TRINITY_DN12063_c0_g1_i1.p1  ORF type:complete len:120 (-),score=15.16 TRINITY_DN12063_c0_g1_i1:311-670(-)
MKEESLEEYMERKLEKRWTELKLRGTSGTAYSNASTVCTSHGTTGSMCLPNTSVEKFSIGGHANLKFITRKKTMQAKMRKKKQQTHNKENNLSRLSIEIHSINKKLDLLNSKVAKNELK